MLCELVESLLWTSVRAGGRRRGAGYLVRIQDPGAPDLLQLNHGHVICSPDASRVTFARTLRLSRDECLLQTWARYPQPHPKTMTVRLPDGKHLELDIYPYRNGEDIHYLSNLAASWRLLADWIPKAEILMLHLYCLPHNSCSFTTPTIPSPPTTICDLSATSRTSCRGASAKLTLTRASTALQPAGTTRGPSHPPYASLSPPRQDPASVSQRLIENVSPR